MHAVYATLTGWGYRVQIVGKGASGPEIIEEHDAGDCRHDSAVFGTGEIDALELDNMAKATAKMMLEERGHKDGEVEYDEDILADERERMGFSLPG